MFGSHSGVASILRTGLREGRMLFGLGAVLQHSHTPSLRVTGFEDDDEDENENEAPCEGGFVFCVFPGLKPRAESCSPRRIATRSVAGRAFGTKTLPCPRKSAPDYLSGTS